QLLGIGNGRMRHALLVLAPKSGKTILHSLQRLADPGYIAMPENRPATGEERFAILVHLHGEIAHHRLRGGQPDRCHAFILSLAAPRPTGRKGGHIYRSSLRQPDPASWSRP